MLGAVIHSTAIHAETTESETTGDLLGTQWETTGAVQQGDDYVRFSYTQGVARQEIDLSDYDHIDSLTYGAEFLGCNNFIGGWCGSTNSTYYDQVVVKLYVNDSVYEQTVTTNFNQGWLSHEWTVDLSESATSAILQFSGYDPGYWAGWYGAIVRNPYLNATHSWTVIEPIVNPVTPTVEEPTASSMVADGILTDIIIAPAIPGSASVDLSPDIEPVVDHSIPQDMGMTNQIETVAESVEQPGQVEQTSQAEQPEQVDQQEQVEQAVAEVKAEGGKVSAKAIAQQLGDAYNPAAQAAMMALMQTNQIKQPKMIDAQFYVDVGLKEKPIGDRYWLDSLVGDLKFEKMVDSQYE